MTLGQFLTEIVNFVRNLATDFAIYLAAGVVVGIGVALFRRFVRAGR